MASFDQKYQENVLNSLEDYEVISDDDPCELYYTGDWWIVKKDKKYGLVRPQKDGNYFLKIKPAMSSIISYTYGDPAKREQYFAFLLYDDADKIALFINGELYKGGHRFEEWIYAEDTPDTPIIKENGKWGYIDLMRVSSYPHIDPVLSPSHSPINWDDMDWKMMTWLNEDILIPNKAGKWAILTSDWEPMTDFVFDSEPGYGIHGKYMLYPITHQKRKEYNKKDLQSYLFT